MTQRKKKRIRGKVPDWSSLPEDIWNLIISKLPLEDHIRCQSVSWFFCSIAQVQHCSSKPRAPWLLHRVDKHSDTKTMFDLTSNKVYKIHLPELWKNTILGSSEGWLILVDEWTSELRLFSPFTREAIPLPPTVAFPCIVGANRVNHDPNGQVTDYHMRCPRDGLPDLLFSIPRWELSKKLLISAFMFSSSSGHFVVVRHAYDGFGVARVRSGKSNAAWTAVQIPNGEAFKCNFAFFENLLYVMDYGGRVLSFDLSSSDNSPPVPLQVAPPAPNIFPRPVRVIKYLVTLPDNGELLLILMNQKNELRAFKLANDKQQWVEVSTLFGHSLFLTSKIYRPPSMMCVSSKNHPAGMKRNCIYFTEGASVEVLDMDDGRSINSYNLEHISPKVSVDRREPVWIEPIITSL